MELHGLTALSLRHLIWLSVFLDSLSRFDFSSIDAMVTITHAQARVLGWVVPILLTAVGYLSWDPELFLRNVGTAFIWLSVFNIAGSLVTQLLARLLGGRIQEDRGKDLTLQAIFESERALYVVACLAAWPMTREAVGLPTAFKATLAEASWGGSAALYLLKVAGGLMAADAWNYWKHRTLHNRALWAIHATHHKFRDPTAFVGFAIHPVEALATFFPILFVCMPQLYLWMPLHAPFIIGFIVLNFYLHCGYSVEVIERFLPRAFINTSVFHNKHHAKTVTHFGEMLSLWCACG